MHLVLQIKMINIFLKSAITENNRKDDNHGRMTSYLAIWDKQTEKV